jgi:hypothetical protein
MSSPFAAIESRINSAVERRLANVEVVHGGGQPFGAVLDRVPSAPYGVAVDSSLLVLGFIATRAPGLVEGGELLVNGVAHIVTGDVQPSETGWLKVNVHAKA